MLRRGAELILYSIKKVYDIMGLTLQMASKKLSDLSGNPVVVFRVIYLLLGGFHLEIVRF